MRGVVDVPSLTKRELIEKVKELESAIETLEKQRDHAVSRSLEGVWIDEAILRRFSVGSGNRDNEIEITRREAERRKIPERFFVQ